jgi:hypothetical protein
MIRTLHLLVAVAALALAGWGVWISLTTSEELHHKLPRGLASAALILCTLAWGQRALERPYHWSGLVTYLVSAVASVGVLQFWVTGLVKGFPPASEGDAVWLGVAAFASFVFVLALVYLMWRLSERRMTPDRY